MGMLEIAAALLPALDAGEPVAVVTVARVARSAPRGPGAAMALRRDGRVIGSVSGGCVEGDALLLAAQVLATGVPLTASLGFDDDAAHAAGLACGGSIDVVVHRVDPDDAVARAALERAAADRAASVGLALTGADAGRAVPIAAESTGFSPAGDLFVIAHAPRPRLVIVGAGEHAMALCRVAAAAGFTVSVCDVWERLVTRERFPAASRIETGMPTAHLAALIGPDPAHAAVCILSHDERVDVPALAEALALGAGFVGAMGARGTVARRRELLAEAGVDAADIARVHSPLGLDLGGASPDETAISVLAEVVAARHGGSGSPLRERTGPLHRRTNETPAPACSPLETMPR